MVDGDVHDGDAAVDALGLHGALPGGDAVAREFDDAACLSHDVGSWAVTVMPALTAADDRTLVDAMQQTIDNPAFPLTFLGAGALAAVALVQARRSGSAKTAGWIVAGLALYTVAVVVTGAIHIPLNEDLKNAGDPARIENLAAVRDDFATPWVAWNIVRTLATTAAFGALAWALLLRGRMGRAA